MIKNDGSILASGNLNVAGSVTLSSLSTSHNAVQLLALNSSKKVHTLEGGSEQAAFQLTGNLISPSPSSNTEVDDFVIGSDRLDDNTILNDDNSRLLFDKDKALLY